MTLPTLKQGMSGDYVILLQSALNICFKCLKKKPLNLKGFFGPDTKRYVLEFQDRINQSRGKELPVNGEVGPATWRELLACRVSKIEAVVTPRQDSSKLEPVIQSAQSLPRTATTSTAGLESRSAATELTGSATTAKAGADKKPVQHPPWYFGTKELSLGPQGNYQTLQIHGRKGHNAPPGFNSLVLTLSATMLDNGITLLDGTKGPPVQHKFSGTFSRNARPYDSRYSLGFNYQQQLTDLFKEGQLALLNPFLNPFLQFGVMGNFGNNKEVGRPTLGAPPADFKFQPSSSQAGVCLGNEVKIDIIQDVMNVTIGGCAALQVDLATGQVTFGPQLYLNLNVDGSLQVY
jgi:hypothetical protein